MSQHSSSLTNHTPEKYNTNASFVYSQQYTNAVLSLLNPQPGERIVDLGCGTGELTLRIGKAVGDRGHVLGIDSSPSMLSKAAHNVTEQKVDLVHADIQDLIPVLDPSLKGSFDAVFTSAVLHWTKRDPKGVIEGVKWLLKPGGRFVFEFGGFGNCVGIRGALHQVIRSKGLDPNDLDPWYFPTVQTYTKVISSGGLVPGDIALHPRPTPLPGDLKAWLHTFARDTFLASFSKDEQDAMIRQVQEICKVDNHWQDDEAEGWEIMYARLRGTAMKPH